MYQVTGKVLCDAGTQTERRTVKPQHFLSSCPGCLIAPAYPAVIDMVNWPSIRDQLILTLRQHDSGEIVKDVVLNTVVNVAASGAALNMHDVFFNRIEEHQDPNPNLVIRGNVQSDTASPTRQSILTQIAQ